MTQEQLNAIQAVSYTHLDVYKRQELAQQIEGGFIPSQFTNSANPTAHFNTTGPEIWEDTDGKVDIFVADQCKCDQPGLPFPGCGSDVRVL